MQLRYAPYVVVPSFVKSDGSTVVPDWVQVDWEMFEVGGAVLPPPAFVPNKYAYQLKSPADLPDDAAPVQKSVHHYVLWYFHRHNEPLPCPSDDEIDVQVRDAVTAAAEDAGFVHADYIWYGHSSPQPLRWPKLADTASAQTMSSSIGSVLC